MDEDQLMERIIYAVKRRPPIYDRRLKEYADKNLKQLLWNEICSELFKDWSDPRVTTETKNQRLIDVVEKWQNVKNWFIREHKLSRSDSGEPACKQRRTLQYQNLCFLLPTMQDGDPNNLLNMTNQPCEGVINNRQGVQTRYIVQNPIVTNVQRNTPFVPENNEDDKNFALSIVSLLRPLSEDDKLQAKIDILKVFKEIKNSKNPSTSGNTETLQTASTQKKCSEKSELNVLIPIEQIGFLVRNVVQKEINAISGTTNQTSTTTQSTNVQEPQLHLDMSEIIHQIKTSPNEDYINGNHFSDSPEN